MANRLTRVLCLIPTSAVRDEEHRLQLGGVTLTGKETLRSIRVRYCGGCNPEIDRGALVSRLQKVIRKAGVEIIFCAHEEADWLLLINGCPRACLEEERFEDVNERQCICVEGANLGHRPVAEEVLAEAVWRTMMNARNEG